MAGAENIESTRECVEKEVINVQFPQQGILL